MTIREREEELFQKWRVEKGYDAFIEDGVLDEKTWNRQTVKLTFVLKEANWPGVYDSLRGLLMEANPGHVWRTWNNVARWTKALLEGGEYPGYISREERKEWLARVSCINLKKAGGGPRARPKELRMAAAKDAPYIRRQLALYQPDLIVCCGWWLTADILSKEVLPPELPVEWREDVNGVPCFYTRIPGKAEKTPVLSFYHPQRVAGRGDLQRWYERLREAGRALPPVSRKPPPASPADPP